MIELASYFSRFWEDLIDRPAGPMSFRFILQPTMATLFAIRDGMKDARTGHSPYFWYLITEPEKRKSAIKEGLKATMRIIILGLVMDVIYQWTVFHAFRPLEAIVLTFGIAFLPYVLMRGPVARFWRWRLARKAGSGVR